MKNLNHYLLLIYVLLAISNIELSRSLKITEQSKQQSNSMKVPEYLNNFVPQGHILDCMNICKKCINHELVEKTYNQLSQSQSKGIVLKDALIQSITQMLIDLKSSDQAKYNINVKERSEFKEEELNPKNLFRIYYDICYTFNRTFYA